MIIWSSINCPTVNWLPTVAIFSREATSEIYGPRVSYLLYLPSRSIVIWFYFRCINPKIQKYLAAIFLFFYLAFPRDLFIQSTTILSTFLLGRDWQPLFLCRVASICSSCAGTIYIVLRGSPTGLITFVSSLREIPTVAMLYHPFLFGEMPT